MKSSRFIQRTDIATLKNDDKISAQISINGQYTVANGTQRAVIASTEFSVGSEDSEPFIIFDKNGVSYLNALPDIDCTLREYSTLSGGWYETSWSCPVQVVRVAPKRYRLEAYIMQMPYTYDAGNPRYYTFSETQITANIHTFKNPFSQ